MLEHYVLEERAPPCTLISRTFPSTARSGGEDRGQGGSVHLTWTSAAAGRQGGFPVVFKGPGHGRVDKGSREDAT